MEFLLIVAGIVGAAWAFGWASSTREAQERRRTLLLLDTRDQSFRESFAKGRKWLADCIAEWRQAFDDAREADLRFKKHPARKAADVVREVKAEKRSLTARLKLVEYQLRSYEEYFPFLEEYREAILDERANLAAGRDNIEELESLDPVQLFLEEAEYRDLSPSGRNQLALDRYVARGKNSWEIGRLYERYLGYEYETAGWRVVYQGAIKGYEDFGRDLICTRGSDIDVVQAKCWSQQKVIREKHIFQLFGTTIHYRKGCGGAAVRPVFITTTNLSPEAMEVAEALQVRVQKTALRTDYPMVKCNINPQTRQKIYHLPFDQQYDKVLVGNHPGERYVKTTAEAESLGFRRAWKWRGGGVKQDDSHS
jgi:restriction endonuclease Mrr